MNTCFHMQMMFLGVNYTESLKMGLLISRTLLIYGPFEQNPFLDHFFKLRILKYIYIPHVLHIRDPFSLSTHRHNIVLQACIHVIPNGQQLV